MSLYGGVPYTAQVSWTVAAGAFGGTSQADANEIARTFAEERAAYWAQHYASVGPQCQVQVGKTIADCINAITHDLSLSVSASGSVTYSPAF